MSENDNTPENVEESTVEPQVESSESMDLEELQNKLAEAEAKAQENWEQLVRAKAEMDNLRRRHERETENAHKFALERFTQELLPVIDSLEMGVDAASLEAADVNKLREGTELTLKMLLAAIEKFGIQAVHPHGEPFDPELHQAMSMLESPEHAPNTVMNVMQKGYLLNKRLIRPAMVVVSKAPAEGNDKENNTKIDEQA